MYLLVTVIRKASTPGGYLNEPQQPLCDFLASGNPRQVAITEPPEPAGEIISSGPYQMPYGLEQQLLSGPRAEIDKVD